jgi:hypothetical protein
MKDEDYFVYNQKKGLEEIAKQLKFINWNMGRVVSFLEGNPTLLKDIKKQMAEQEENETN